MTGRQERRDAARLGITARRQAAAAAEELRSEIRQAALKAVVIRCDEPHRGGQPRLGEATVTPRGVLFISRIDWLPSDELNLRPWLREHLEGAGMSNETYGRALVDDEFIDNLLDRHDVWEQGHPRRGERWLIKAPPHTLVALAPLSGHPPVALWVRCKDHPEAATAIDPLTIVTTHRD